MNVCREGERNLKRQTSREGETERMERKEGRGKTNAHKITGD